MLIVDDDSGARETLSTIFESKDFVVDQSVSGKDAFEKLSSNNYDIALVDIKLPDMEGISLLKKSKKLNKKTAFIIITGYASKTNAIEAIQYGAKGFFVKPVIMEELINRIEELININELQTKISESEEKYKVLVENSPNYVLILQDNIVKYVNKTLCDKSGWSYEEITEPSFNVINKMIHPKDQQKVIEIMKRILTGETIDSYPITFVTRNGELIDGTINGQIINYKGKKAIEYIINDITAIKKLEKSKEKVVKLQKTVFDNVNDAILVIDTIDFTIKTANEKAMNQIGIDDINKIIGKTCYSVTHNRSSPCKEPNDSCPVTKMIDTRKNVTVEHTHYNKKGDPFFVEISASPVRNEKGEIIQAVHVARNITEQKKMIDSVKESEERFRSMVRLAKDSIISADDKGNIISWNKASEEMFGYKKDEVFGKSLALIIPEIYRKKHQLALNKLVKTGKQNIMGQTIEIVGLRKDGTEFPIDLSLSTWSAGNKIFFGAIIRDITEKKNYTENLEKTVLERTEEISKINSEISEKLSEKIDQINQISNIKEKLPEILGVDKKMDKILDMAIKVLKQDVATFIVIDEVKQKSEIRYYKSTKDIKIIDNIEWSQIEKSCLEHRVPKSFLNKEHTCILDTKSVHCAPVFIDDEIIGIFAMGSMNEEILSRENLSVFNLFSGLISPVIEKAKLSIEPVKEKQVASKSKFNLDFGTAYAISDNIDLAYNIFVDQVNSGKEGLCITRIFPEKIRKKYGLKKTPIMWLNEQQSNGIDTVNSLSDCAILISDYLKKAKNPIILIDGIEYLISINEFNQVLRFLQTRRSLVEMSDSVLLVPFDSQAVEKKEYQLLLRELSEFKKSILSK